MLFKLCYWKLQIFFFFLEIRTSDEEKQSKFRFFFRRSRELSCCFRAITPACWLTVNNWTCPSFFLASGGSNSFPRIESLMDRRHVHPDWYSIYFSDPLYLFHPWIKDRSEDERLQIKNDEKKVQGGKKMVENLPTNPPMSSWLSPDWVSIVFLKFVSF